ncbi:MAG: TetR/AcrR family transcriptional regulator [Actinomycetota bacterium]
MNTRSVNRIHYAGDLRSDLIAEAVRVIAEDGTAAVSLRALTRTLGVSHAAPKNHFPTKEALFAEIAREGFVEFAHRLNTAGDAARAAGGDPLAVLEAQGLAYLSFAEDRPSHFALMFRGDLFDPTIVIEEGLAAFETLYTSVTAAQAVGWHQGVDTLQVAMMVWSTVHGLANLETQSLPPAVGTPNRVEILRLALGTNA